MFERSKKGENALLVQPHDSRDDVLDLLSEFRELARSAGADVVATLTARVDAPNPRFYIGSGKAEMIKTMCDEHGADVVLVNHHLSPVQERNLEKLCARRVVDRTGLILDIFAQRARTHEGKLQVELAQLKHMSTRLIRGWTHLERQRGGAIGLRGPGETQLETDRRLLAERVKILTRRLELAEKQRNTSRRARVRGQVPVVALVGYTNTGKSTLFNSLTGDKVLVADQLFATLDPTVRKLHGLQSGEVVIADTVGFVRDLPHDLVAAFRSTLTEARDADVLLHVIDAADPMRDERIEQVNQVLLEIEANEIPQILVFNKIDLIEQDAKLDQIDRERVQRVWLSAIERKGLDLLRQAIDNELARERIQAEINLPPNAGKLHAQLAAAGAIVYENFDHNGWHINIDTPRAVVESLFNGEHGRLLQKQIPPQNTKELE